MSSKIIFRVFLLGLYLLLLVQISTTLSISLFEYNIYSGETFSILYYPLHLFTHLFGQNDLAVRSLMILIHLASLWFYYQVSKPYLTKTKDRNLNLFLFVLLPGTVSSAVIVHDTGLVLLSLLVFIWLYQKKEDYAWIVLPLYFFIDPAFFILFLALFLQTLFEKRYVRAAAALLLMVGSFYFFGFKTDLTPKGFFLETIAVFAIVLSPMIFVFFLYTLFRIGVRGQRDIIWLISISSLIVALGLSFRQKIPIEQFAPFIMILLPVMLKLFLHTLRMRIKVLRRYHYAIFGAALFFLLLNSLSMYANKIFYLWLDTPQKHFLYEHHIAKELAKELHDKNIASVLASDASMQKRLAFYGIAKAEATHRLTLNGCKNVTIRYVNTDIASFCVTKLNKK